MQILSLIMLTLGCCLLYLSNKNQGWLAEAMSSRPWRIMGWIFIFSALIGWLKVLNTSTALFTWMVSLMLIFGVLPFISLLLNRTKQGVSVE